MTENKELINKLNGKQHFDHPREMEIVEVMEFLKFGVKPTSGIFQGKMCFHFKDDQDDKDITYMIEIDKNNQVSIEKNAKAKDATCEVTVNVADFLYMYSGKASASELAKMCYSGKIKVHGFGYRSVTKFAQSFDFSSDKWKEFYLAQDKHIKEEPVVGSPSMNDGKHSMSRSKSVPNILSPSSTENKINRDDDKINVSSKVPNAFKYRNPHEIHLYSTEESKYLGKVDINCLPCKPATLAFHNMMFISSPKNRSLFRETNEQMEALKKKTGSQSYAELEYAKAVQGMNIQLKYLPLNFSPINLSKKAAVSSRKHLSLIEIISNISTTQKKGAIVNALNHLPYLKFGTLAPSVHPSNVSQILKLSEESKLAESDQSKNLKNKHSLNMKRRRSSKNGKPFHHGRTGTYSSRRIPSSSSSTRYSGSPGLRDFLEGKLLDNGSFPFKQNGLGLQSSAGYIPPHSLALREVKIQVTRMLNKVNEKTLGRNQVSVLPSPMYSINDIQRNMQVSKIFDSDATGLSEKFRKSQLNNSLPNSEHIVRDAVRQNLIYKTNRIKKQFINEIRKQNARPKTEWEKDIEKFERDFIIVGN